MNELTILLLLGLGVVALAGAVLVYRRRWAPATGCAVLGVVLAWQLALHAPVLSALLALGLAAIG